MGSNYEIARSLVPLPVINAHQNESNYSMTYNIVDFKKELFLVSSFSVNAPTKAYYTMDVT